MHLAFSSLCILLCVTHFNIQIINEQKVQECDATGDAMKFYSLAYKTFITLSLSFLFTHFSNSSQGLPALLLLLYSQL